MSILKISIFDDLFIAAKTAILLNIYKCGKKNNLFWIKFNYWSFFNQPGFENGSVLRG